MERYIPQFLTYMENAVTVEKDLEGNISLRNPDAKYLIIDQDEKCHHSNDVEKL